MCYSALVTQNSKTLGLTYRARIDLAAFGILFEQRIAGSGAKIPIGLEASFLENPASADEKRIAKLILEWRKLESTKLEKDLFTQVKRLADAERTLLTKVTQKAENDRRIATDKIAKLRFRLGRYKSSELLESDSRIFPGQYAPLVVGNEGGSDERWVRPFRYLLRPAGQSPDFDRRYDGCYNARRDSLGTVAWWKASFARHHGVMAIQSFWENVKRHDFEHRDLRAGEAQENLVLRFNAEGIRELNVACLYARNTAGPFPLDSFALITDEPNPEVAAAGHNRTPIFLKDEHLGLWLSPGADRKAYDLAMDDKQPTFFSHVVAA